MVQMRPLAMIGILSLILVKPLTQAAGKDVQGESALYRAAMRCFRAVAIRGATGGGSRSSGRKVTARAPISSRFTARPGAKPAQAFVHVDRDSVKLLTAHGGEKGPSAGGKIGSGVISAEGKLGLHVFPHNTEMPSRAEHAAFYAAWAAKRAGLAKVEIEINPAGRSGFVSTVRTGRGRRGPDHGLQHRAATQGAPLSVGRSPGDSTKA